MQIWHKYRIIVDMSFSDLLPEHRIKELHAPKPKFNAENYARVIFQSLIDLRAFDENQAINRSFCDEAIGKLALEIEELYQRTQNAGIKIEPFVNICGDIVSLLRAYDESAEKYPDYQYKQKKSLIMDDTIWTPNTDLRIPSAGSVRGLIIDNEEQEESLKLDPNNIIMRLPKTVYNAEEHRQIGSERNQHFNKTNEYNLHRTFIDPSSWVSINAIRRIQNREPLDAENKSTVFLGMKDIEEFGIRSTPRATGDPIIFSSIPNISIGWKGNNQWRYVIEIDKKKEPESIAEKSMDIIVPNKEIVTPAIDSSQDAEYLAIKTIKPIAEKYETDLTENAFSKRITAKDRYESSEGKKLLVDPLARAIEKDQNEGKDPHKWLNNTFIRVPLSVMQIYKNPSDEKGNICWISDWVKKNFNEELSLVPKIPALGEIVIMSTVKVDDKFNQHNKDLEVYLTKMTKEEQVKNLPVLMKAIQELTGFETDNFEVSDAVLRALSALALGVSPVNVNTWNRHIKLRTVGGRSLFSFWLDGRVKFRSIWVDDVAGDYVGVSIAERVK